MEEKSIDNSAVTINEHLEPAMSVGKTLREARERLGLSLVEVSNRIKFSQKQIEALEADDLDSLPEPAFVRGFIRSYARLLQLDSATLLAMVGGGNESVAKPVATQIINEPFAIIQSSPSKKHYWLVAPAVLILALIVFLAISKNAQLATTPVAVEPANPNANNKGTVEQSIALPIAVEPNSSAPTVDSALQPNALPSANIAEEQKTTVTATDVPKSASNPTTSTVAPLHLVFIEDTWVEVKDHSGKSLSNQVSQRGSELWLNGQAPFTVTLKRPRGVRLFYRGKETDLSAYSTTDVARLTLE